MFGLGSATIVAIGTVIATEPRFTTGLLLLASIGMLVRRKKRG